MIKKVNNCFEEFHFGNATDFFQTFWIHYFCDFYLESTKVAEKTPGNQAYLAKQQVIFHVLVESLRVLHPMMPFLTEELFQKLPNFKEKSESICLEKYPSYSEKLENQESADSFESVLTFIKETRSLVGPLNLPSKHKPKLFLSYIGDEDSKMGDLMMKYEPFIKLMTKTSSLEFSKVEDLPKECLETVVLAKLKVNAFIKGFLDIEKEIKKTQKKINGINKQLQKLNTKMSMPDYQDQTPEKIRLKEEAKVKNYQTEIVALEGIKSKFTAMKA